MTKLRTSSGISSSKITTESGVNTGVVSCGSRTWATLMWGTDALAFDSPLGQAGGKSGIGLDCLEFGVTSLLFPITTILTTVLILVTNLAISSNSVVICSKKSITTY